MPRYHGAERYPDPESARGEILVVNRNPKLDEPPASDEGEIRNVDFEYSNGLARAMFKQCQVCRTSIEWAAPHVLVSVFLYGPEDSAIPGNHKSVHLCDRECWADWATGCIERESI